MTTVLVTGAAGMIGGATVTHLEGLGVEVWTCDLQPLDREHHHTLDLTEPGAANELLRSEPPDAIIHLAGAVAGDLASLLTSNVLGTVRLLDALPPGSRVVVAGSAAEHAGIPNTAARIGAEPTPLSPYGWAKAAQTSIAMRIAAARGHRLSVVRPFNVVGPRVPATTALGRFKEQLSPKSDRSTLTVGNLDVVRDYVTVDFVAAVLAAVALDPDGPDSVDACSGVGVRLGDVLDAMIALLGIDVVITSDPNLATLPAAHVAVGDPAVVTARYGLKSDLDALGVARSVLGDLL